MGAAFSTYGSGFIELADLSRVQVIGDFTEADTTKIKLGQRATVSFDALSGVTARGKVVAIDTAATTSNNVVQYGVTVRLVKKPAKVRIGQTVKILTTGSTEIRLSTTGAAKDLKSGDTVVVRGSGDSGGGITATSVTESSGLTGGLAGGTGGVPAGPPS